MKQVGWALFFAIMILGQAFIVITLAERKNRDDRLADNILICFRARSMERSNSYGY